MRHQYTPVFREFTTSSMWAESPSTRCVWLYLMLHADPEGFVPGTIPGLAIAANVPLDDTRRAIEKFLAPDPDSNTQAHEGRRLEKVPHGWRILNFEYWRELARREAEKARKRRWANARRRAENDNDPAEPESPEHADDALVYLSTDVDASGEKLDAPKPKPKPTPKPKEEEESPLPPAAFEPFSAPVIQVVRTHTTLDGLDETGLEDEAVMAGMSREWFRERLASARNITIGGANGVRDQREWVRQQFGRWKTWEEGRAKAQRAALAAPQKRFGESALPVEPFEPSAAQKAFAAQHGVDLDGLLRGVLADHPQPLAAPLSRRGVLGERLTVAAKQLKSGHPVTGKLTAAERAAWGPVPPGGAIPEVA